MHEDSLNFFRYVVKNFPEKFDGYLNVLDVGSGDINGNLRRAFAPTVKYQGNDVYPGKNVDIVSPTHELPFFKPTFDTIVSSECFELDPFYNESLKKITEILKPGGLFAFTCASSGRPEYGTKKTTPFESLGTKGNLSKYKNYYKNITFEDIDESINLKSIFSQFAVYYNNKHKDLYFFGIKKEKMNSKIYEIPVYSDKNTEVIKIYPKNNIEKSAEKPAEKTVEKPAEKTVEKPAVKSFFISSEAPKIIKENIQENTAESITEKNNSKKQKSKKIIQPLIIDTTEAPDLQPQQIISQDRPSKYFDIDTSSAQNE